MQWRPDRLAKNATACVLEEGGYTTAGFTGKLKKL